MDGLITFFCPLLENGFNILYLCSKRWNGKFQSDTMEHSVNISVMCSCFHSGSNFSYWPIPYYYLCFQQSSESPRRAVIGKNSSAVWFGFIACFLFVCAMVLCDVWTEPKNLYPHLQKNKTKHQSNNIIWYLWKAWVYLFNLSGRKSFQSNCVIINHLSD